MPGVVEFTKSHVSAGNRVPGRRRRMHAVLTLSLIWAGAFQPVSAQDPAAWWEWDDAIAWRYSGSIPPRVIRGAVVVADGSPLAEVQVWIPGTEVGALSDSLGHFSFEVPRAGPWRVAFERIGLMRAEEDIVVLDDRGIQMVGIMKGVTVHGPGHCAELFRGGNVEVSVTVRGARLPPPDGYTLRVTDPDGTTREATLSPEATGPGSDGTSIVRLLSKPGRYTIEVEAPGYAPWRAEEVELIDAAPYHPCSTMWEERVLSAELRPLDPV